MDGNAPEIAHLHYETWSEGSVGYADQLHLYKDHMLHNKILRGDERTTVRGMICSRFQRYSVKSSSWITTREG